MIKFYSIFSDSNLISFTSHQNKNTLKSMQKLFFKQKLHLLKTNPITQTPHQPYQSLPISLPCQPSPPTNPFSNQTSSAQKSRGSALPLFSLSLSKNDNRPLCSSSSSSRTHCRGKSALSSVNTRTKAAFYIHTRAARERVVIIDHEPIADRSYKNLHTCERAFAFLRTADDRRYAVRV